MCPSEHITTFRLNPNGYFRIRPRIPSNFTLSFFFRKQFADIQADLKRFFNMSHLEVRHYFKISLVCDYNPGKGAG